MAAEERVGVAFSDPVVFHWSLDSRGRLYTTERVQHCVCLLQSPSEWDAGFSRREISSDIWRNSSGQPQHCWQAEYRYPSATVHSFQLRVHTRPTIAYVQASGVLVKSLTKFSFIHWAVMDIPSLRFWVSFDDLCTCEVFCTDLKCFRCLEFVFLKF